MISGLSGKIVQSKEGAVEIDVNGICFTVFVPRRYARQVPKSGNVARFYTYLHTNREEAPALFGFLTEEELVFFKLLLSVNGVGPRMALNILSASSTEKLAAAVTQGRPDIIEKAQGVGKKTAMRIVLELKDKMKYPKKNALLGLEEEDADEDVKEALSALGYKQTAVRTAIEKIDPKLIKIGDRLRDALKKIK